MPAVQHGEALGLRQLHGRDGGEGEPLGVGPRPPRGRTAGGGSRRPPGRRAATPATAGWSRRPAAGRAPARPGGCSGSGGGRSCALSAISSTASSSGPSCGRATTRVPRSRPIVWRAPFQLAAHVEEPPALAAGHALDGQPAERRQRETVLVEQVEHARPASSGRGRTAGRAGREVGSGRSSTRHMSMEMRSRTMPATRRRPAMVAARLAGRRASSNTAARISGSGSANARASGPSSP